jgi:hypothetical protein
MYQGNLFTPPARIPNYHRSFSLSVMCILNASASICLDVALVTFLNNNLPSRAVLGFSFLASIGIFAVRQLCH